MPQVPGVWSWSKNIFADMTFRTSCCKSAAPGSGWAMYKTQLWSSVARLGMPQADQTSCRSFLETSQHLQKLPPVCSGPPGFMVAHAARTTWGIYFHQVILSPWCLLLFFKHRFIPNGFNFKFSPSFQSLQPDLAL